MEEQEFTRRIRGMTERLYKVCYAQLANTRDREDAVQECICKAWQQRHQLRQPAYFETWVIRILLNVCHDTQRTNARVTPTDDVSAYESDLTRTYPNPEERELHDALLRLDPKQRLPLVLHHMCGFSTHEVARILRTRPGTVRARMSRARVRLRELLDLGLEVTDTDDGAETGAVVEATNDCYERLT